MDKKIRKVGCLLLVALIVLLLYIVLHEGGHLIVMLSAGATITEFSILTAHVSGIGGNYTNVSDLWLHANGALLPVIVSFAYMLFYKKKSKSMFYHFFSYMVCLMSICSSLAWVVIPFLYMQGNAPEGDDVTKFLYNFSTNYHPLLICIVAALIIAVGVIVMIKKEIIRNVQIIMKQGGLP